MSVDMSPSAVAARVASAQPPDLRPENRLRWKVDMTPTAIEGRLRQVAELVKLATWLALAGETLRVRDASADQREPDHAADE